MTRKLYYIARSKKCLIFNDGYNVEINAGDLAAFILALQSQGWVLADEGCSLLPGFESCSLVKDGGSVEVLSDQWFASVSFPDKHLGTIERVLSVIKADRER